MTKIDLEKIAERIVDQQIKTPLLFIVLFAIITALLVPGIFNLVNNVEPSLEKVLPQDIEEVKLMNDMRTQFGADMMYLIVYAQAPVSDVRNPEYLTYIDMLTKKIRTNEYVLEATSLADVIKDSNNEIIPDSIIENKQITRTNPMTSMYVNPEYSFSVIRIRSDTGASASVIKELVEKIEFDIETMEEFNPGSRIEITGFNAIDKATFEVIMSDFAFITLIAMTAVGIVVFITFRSFVRGMLPMIVVMNALIWTMGIAGYFNFTITVVTMVAAAMIMGLGIDFGIHVVHNYFEQRKDREFNGKFIKAKSKDVAMKDTMKELLRAMIAASLTTTAGFLALLFGVLPAMKTLGMVLGIGIMTTLVGSVFLLPVIVYLYDKDKIVRS